MRPKIIKPHPIQTTQTPGSFVTWSPVYSLAVNSFKGEDEFILPLFVEFWKVLQQPERVGVPDWA